METHYETKDKIMISGSNNTFHLKQVLQFDGFDLDSFYKRLKWLLTGKARTYIEDNGENTTLSDALIKTN